MIEDIQAAIPLGFFLAFMIGPVFFMLIETSITKGFRAAMVFDLGVICGDLVFILIAYFSTNQLLEKLKDDPSLFFLGGTIMLSYGIISFIKQKNSFKNKEQEDLLNNETPKSNNYLKKGDLILTGAYGFPVPINDKKIIEVTSSAFGGVKAIFN